MSMNHSGVGRDKIIDVLKEKNSGIFFLGIGGAGQSALARLLFARGYAVSGSDRVRSEVTDSLVSDGVRVFIGHMRENFSTQKMLVYTLAVGDDTPEITAARSNGALIVSRAELLGALMSFYNEAIGVSGTHGKSTTTAIINHIFKCSGMAHTTLSGAPLLDSSSLYIGGDEYLIYEACEYRDSFLHFEPSTQIITSVQLDHTDYFKSIEQLEQSFLLSCRGAKSVIINTDGEVTRRLCHALGAISYGTGYDADYRYIITRSDFSGSDFTVLFRGEHLGDFHISQIGAHNVANATAAVALSYIYNIKEEIIKKALFEFTGIDRRIERLGRFGIRPLYYDYAHHPSEIEATFDALKAIHGKVTVVFAPHTYSRTASLWNDFVAVLSRFDNCVLVPIYPAREVAIDGVSSEHLAFDIGKGAICLDPISVMPYVRDNTAGAIVLMGAGDLNLIKNAFLQSNIYIKDRK